MSACENGFESFSSWSFIIVVVKLWSPLDRRDKRSSHKLCGSAHPIISWYAVVQHAQAFARETTTACPKKNVSDPYRR